MPKKKVEEPLLENAPVIRDKSYDEMSNEELINALIERDGEIINLKQEIEYFKRDGLAGSLYALNYQLNKINTVILEANITLRGDDKQFERFWKIMTSIQEVHVSIENLRNMLFPKTPEEEKDETKSHNFMDEMAEKNGYTN